MYAQSCDTVGLAVESVLQAPARRNKTGMAGKIQALWLASRLYWWCWKDSLALHFFDFFPVWGILEVWVLYLQVLLPDF